MKQQKSTILQAIAIIALMAGTAACNEAKVDDSKDMATEQNEPRSEQQETLVDDKKTDAEFMVEAAEMNNKIIELGKIAQQKGNINTVKELGTALQNDHTTAQAELMALAKTNAIVLPVTNTDATTSDINKLNEKSGKDFGVTYSDMMVKDHNASIKLYEDIAMNSENAGVKTWVNARLVSLRSHLEMAIQCQNECSATQ